MLDPEFEKLVISQRPAEYELFLGIRDRLIESQQNMVEFDMYLGPLPTPDAKLVEKPPAGGPGPFPLSHWRWSTEAPRRAIDDTEMRYFNAITSALRADERDFGVFQLMLGPRPPGHELREIPGRRRPAFKLSHFEWVQMAMPRQRPEPNKILRAVQDQIRAEELGRLSEPMEKRASVF